MKVLLMPVRPQPRETFNPVAKRRFEAIRFGASIVVVLLACLAATIAVACGLALALMMVLGVAAASAALLIFMVVSPEGNLLLLLLLSQVWLLYAPRKASPGCEPDGGLKMEAQDQAVSQSLRSLAA